MSKIPWRGRRCPGWATLAGLSLVVGICMPAAAQPWLPGAWQYRVPLTVNPLLVSGAHTGFPVLVSLNAADAHIFAAAKADGTDLVVTRADGVTRLPREIVRWDPMTPAAEIWFRADSLSATTNVFYLYYGNPGAAQPPLESAVWGSKFLAVYHFAENPALGVLWDSAPGGHHGLAGAGSAWSALDAIPGRIDRAWRFNGTTNWVDGDAIQSADSTFTISGWFACWNLANHANFAFSSGGSPWHVSAKRNESQHNADFAHARGYYRWYPDLADTLLHHYAWTVDGVNDTIRFYFDGVERGIKIRYVAPAAKPPDKVYLGLNIVSNVGVGSNLFGNASDLMEGIVDEYRVLEGTRAPSWIRTEFNNQSQPNTFLSLGPPEQYPVDAGDRGSNWAVLPPRGEPNPFRRSTMIQFALAGREAVRVAVYGTDGRRVRRLYEGEIGPGAVRLPWDGKDDRGNLLGSGVYFVRVETKARSWAGRVVLLR